MVQYKSVVITYCLMKCNNYDTVFTSRKEMLVGKLASLFLFTYGSFGPVFLYIFGFLTFSKYKLFAYYISNKKTDSGSVP
jgi:hypothetical protein